MTDHALFWDYEPVLRKIAHWLASTVRSAQDEEDIYQDSCVYFLTLHQLGKFDERVLCNKYIWKRIGWSMKKELMALTRSDAIVAGQAMLSHSYVLDMISKYVATVFLGCKQATLLQKQILYRFYCMGEDTQTIAADMQLPHKKILSQRSLGIRNIRKAYAIEPRDKDRVWDKDDLRVWGPTQPVDTRHVVRSWVVRFREGSRGRANMRFFDSWNAAWGFRRRLEKKNGLEPTSTL